MKNMLITIAAVVLVGCGPSTSIHNAAGEGNIEAVKQQLAAGTDVNAKGKYEETPLHYATLEDHKEIVELLIANGADVNAKDNKDETPLNMAYISDQTEIADLLSKHGGKTGFQLQSSGN